MGNAARLSLLGGRAWALPQPGCKNDAGVFGRWHLISCHWNPFTRVSLPPSTSSSSTLRSAWVKRISALLVGPSQTVHDFSISCCLETSFRLIFDDTFIFFFMLNGFLWKLPTPKLDSLLVPHLHSQSWEYIQFSNNTNPRLRWINCGNALTGDKGPSWESYPHEPSFQWRRRKVVIF